MLSIPYPSTANPPDRLNVAMLHLGRCGSGVLGAILRQQPASAIFWEGELIYRLRAGMYENAPSDPLTLLEQRMQHATTRVYGFETKIHHTQDLAPESIHMTTNAYIAALTELGFDAFILLKRENYLRQIVSYHVGWKTQKWHFRGQQEPKLTPVTINPTACRFGEGGQNRIPLLTLFQQFDALYHELEQLLATSPTLSLIYEQDILPNPMLAYQKLCHFLNLPPHPITIRDKRTNPFPLEEIIVNYNEVKIYLAGTTYEWMCH